MTAVRDGGGSSRELLFLPAAGGPPWILRSQAAPPLCHNSYMRVARMSISKHAAFMESYAGKRVEYAVEKTTTFLVADFQKVWGSKG